MRRNSSRLKSTTILVGAWIVVMVWSCAQPGSSKQSNEVETKKPIRPKHISKPPSHYGDTLVVDKPAAVFYYPDSLQLENIKSLLDTNVYKGIMHDYFFQMRYGHITIKKTWPQLCIIDAKQCRYLLFRMQGSSQHVIDLDSISDVYGLFVFGKNKNPLLVDLTNLNTQVSFYLQK